MNAAEYLRSTPPEIVLKIEALKDERRYQASRDYQFIIALLNGYNDSKKFPSFDRFYPEKMESGEQKVGWYVKKAMETARKIGDIA